jgi:phospholipase C
MINNTDRRRVLQMLGTGAIASTLDSSVAKALAIPANNRTGTIKDVEHIVILMQENRPFDHHFGTLRGVRGFADPRAVQINLPLQSGGAVKASVFLQPAGAGFGVPANSGNLGGPANSVPVIPPFRIDPSKISPGLTTLGFTYIGGTDHSWEGTHLAWNLGQYDNWAIQKGPLAMHYFTRADIPYHYALADAFTVLDNYYSSIMGPTNPNRCYLFTGSVGNVSYLGAKGTDGHGSGPITDNGLPLGHDLAWETLPEVLDKAGVTWRIYQDLEGATFAPDFGDGSPANNFDGNFTDNSLLYFAQYAASRPGTSLFDNACTGTGLASTKPPAGAPAPTWEAWAESLFQHFKDDVKKGTLPQVSWLVAPAGYTEHASFPNNYGAWYISQVLNILVSKPELFSKTVFIINYDEADGSFDHVVQPSPPATSSFPAAPDLGGSTVDYRLEIVTTSTPNAPIGLGTRVPCLVISPWSKGGYVNSQVFDHTSVIQFIEKRFGVHERNLSPWRRAVCGDLTSVFNFKNPNDKTVDLDLPSTTHFLPSVGELSGAVNPPNVNLTANNVIIGVPPQEKGVRPARALPYELNVYSMVRAFSNTVELRFVNGGSAGAVFQVRSGKTTDPVRTYTVEAGKQLSGSWTVSGSYDLTVYGPNGFTRYFKGSFGLGAVAVDVHSEHEHGSDDNGSFSLSVRNAGSRIASVTLLDAYTGEKVHRVLPSDGQADFQLSLDRFQGWYDVVVTVAEDRSFQRRLAGHVETGRDSMSDPAMGGLVTLKA